MEKYALGQTHIIRCGNRNTSYKLIQNSVSDSKLWLRGTTQSFILLLTMLLCVSVFCKLFISSLAGRRTPGQLLSWVLERGVFTAVLLPASPWQLYALQPSAASGAGRSSAPEDGPAFPPVHLSLFSSDSPASVCGGGSSSCSVCWSALSPPGPPLHQGLKDIITQRTVELFKTWFICSDLDTDPCSPDSPCSLIQTQSSSLTGPWSAASSSPS